MRFFPVRSCVFPPLLLALTVGCAEPLPPGSRVDTFRVLAEQADMPYAAPGETVRVNTLSYDPLGRPITWAWAACVNPASSSVDGCLAKVAEGADPSSALLAFGEGVDSVDVPIPADALESLPQGARAAAMLGVLSVACPGDLRFESGAGGLPFSCKEADTDRELGLDEFVVGVKRIFLRAAERNQNPVIARISFDGRDWPESEVKEVESCKTDGFTYADCTTGKHQLAAHVAPESFEAGQDEAGNAFSEQVIVQYFATEGIFEFDVRKADQPESGWVARRRASGQELSVWFVVHDNRGGVSWAERRVRVR